MNRDQIEAALEDADARLATAQANHHHVCNRLKTEAGKLLTAACRGHSAKQTAAVLGIPVQQFNEMEGRGAKKRYTVQRILATAEAAEKIDWDNIPRVPRGRTPKRLLDRANHEPATTDETAP